MTPVYCGRSLSFSAICSSEHCERVVKNFLFDDPFAMKCLVAEMRVVSVLFRALGKQLEGF